jgi:DNA-binding response OmpR family regulator
VEDDPSIADLVDMYLRRDGHDVLSVGTGAAALAAVTDRRPDVVVLDIGLPDMDGLEVCRRIRSDDPALGIIFLTARDDEVDRVLGLEFGADDYVTKPFSPRELVARVKALLRRAEVRIDGTGTPAVQIGETVRNTERQARRAGRGGTEFSGLERRFPDGMGPKAAPRSWVARKRSHQLGMGGGPHGRRA